MEPKIAISACLLGIKCRYDGGDALREELLQNRDDYLPLCPEQLGGLSTPRNPAEIEGGNGKAVIEGRVVVIDIKGRDVTEQFLKGAEETLQQIKAHKIKKMLLKEGSPSCGVKRIRRAGRDLAGPGVTTALLLKAGITVEGIE